MPSAPALPWLTAAPPPTPRRVGAPRRRWSARRVRLVGAGLCAFLATWLLVGLVVPDPPPHTVLTPVRALPAGHALSPDDVRTTRVHDDVFPPGALTGVDQAVGRRLARPVGVREILTSATLTVAGDLAAGDRAVHVPVADPGALLPLHTGDHVDLVEGGAGRVVVAAARVLSVDDPAAEKGGHGIVVAVPEGSVAQLVPAMGTNGPGVTPTLRNPESGRTRP